MSLLQISDPSISNDDLKKFVVGIDLGTTNSLIASYDTELKLYEDNSSNLIPSVVSITKEDILIGVKAADASDDKNTTCISSIKRIMGLSYSDTQNLASKDDLLLIKSKNDLPCIAVNNKEYSAIDISSKILSHLKMR